MLIDQILKQNWDPNLKGKRTSSSAGQPLVVSVLGS